MNNRPLNHAAHEYIVKKKLARQEKTEMVVIWIAATGFLSLLTYWLLIY